MLAQGIIDQGLIVPAASLVDLAREPCKGAYKTHEASRCVILNRMAVITEEAYPACLLRAQGCMLGQVAGDSLGALVEFQSAPAIERRYPGGPRDLEDGGTWQTLAGQPTDDSEMALALARSIIASGGYDENAAAKAYIDWYRSAPFDIGNTIAQALSAGAEAEPDSALGAAKRAANRESQANGALMRISPLAIRGASMRPAALEPCARADALITHPHPVCQDANVVYTAAIAFAIRTGASPCEVYGYALKVAENSTVLVAEALKQAKSGAPIDCSRHQGWVLIALQNAFFQLLHAPNLTEGIVDTVRRGGDTDTNAAIAGALLGAVYGIGAVPVRWVQAILNCRPAAGAKGVRQPRPDIYWPTVVLSLAERLLRTD